MGLQDLDAQYDQTQAPERQARENVPDGSYQVRIDKIELTESEENGTPMLKFDTIVQAGPHANRHLFFVRFITVNTLPYTKADLSVLGWKHKLSDLEDHTKLADLLDHVIEVRKVTKGVNPKGYPDENVFINKLVATKNGGPVAAPAGQPAQAATPAGSPIVGRTVTHAAAPAGGRTGGPKREDEPPF